MMVRLLGLGGGLVVRLVWRDEEDSEKHKFLT